MNSAKLQAYFGDNATIEYSVGERTKVVTFIYFPSLATLPNLNIQPVKGVSNSLQEHIS